MAKFEAGNSGRPKGAKNKATQRARQIVEKYFIDDGGMQNLVDAIQEIEEPYTRATVQLKLLEFFMPKQKEIRIEDNSEEETPLDFTQLTEEELRDYEQLTAKCQPKQED